MPTYDDNLSFTNTPDYSTSIVCTMIPSITFQKIVHAFFETTMPFSFYENNKKYHNRVAAYLSE